jgi:hypothetical protein
VVICQASRPLTAENLRQEGALPLGQPVDAPGRAQELRISLICPATMRTSRTQDPLVEVLELALEHPEPARLLPIWAGLWAITARELLLLAIDAELEGAGL